MAEPSSCLLWHRQTDLSGSWKCWHLFGRLSDTSVPLSHFCKQMLMVFFSPHLWHKYLDPWYLIREPRPCDITSYKDVLERLRLNNKRALGYGCLWIVSVPMQIYRPELASTWLWWQSQCTHQARYCMTSNEFHCWCRNWEGIGEGGQRGVRNWSLCGLGIQLDVHRMHPRLCLLFICGFLDRCHYAKQPEFGS